GLNCATGPDLMKEHIKYLSENSPFMVSCIPNAGLPENVGGHAVYRLTPVELRMALMHFVEDLGVQVVGGCCGTTPEHIAQLAEMTADLQPKERHRSDRYANPPYLPLPYTPSAASIFNSQPYDQDNSFLIVGERLNASGSKKCREMLNAEDWDGLVGLARSQVKEGAHILDVNVDYVGRDGEKDMYELASRLVNTAKLPLMLDSTEWTKMEAGLKVAGGKCILNSTNYEDGKERFFKVLELAKSYGAGVVVGTIDEDGMARTAEKKFEIAQRAYRDAVEYGIPAHEIFFDPLALPVSTGIEEDRENGKATIESIKMIRDNLPGCHIILGVSNVSFGLNPAARITLNSVFLHDACEMGMDSAIVSAAKILPMVKIEAEHQKICRDLLWDRREFEGEACTYDPLIELTQLFEGKTTKSVRGGMDENLPLEERLTRHIIDGERIGLEDQLALALKQYPPLEIVNTFLLDGMKTVGELFGSGQMQLPFVLQSAQTMKAAVAYLEPYMEKTEADGNGKGTVVIATVKGDVHDIGKNLVDIILSNNGYKVVNIGIKQPVENIIQAYEESQADCIAMSGLLVKSTAFMKDNLESFNERGITVPVILGGAALTPKFVKNDCQDVYNGQVIYGKDAFADLHFMDKLMPAKQAENWDDAKGFLDEVSKRNGRAESNGAADSNGAAESPQPELPKVIDTRRSDLIAIDIKRPEPPFWGTKILNPEDISLADLFWYLDLKALISVQWQFRKAKNKSKEEHQLMLQEKVYPLLEQWKSRIIEEKLLAPQVIYGYFPCLAEGNSLHIYDPSVVDEAVDFPEPVVTMEFPRQSGKRRLCISDFFLPKESAAPGQYDVFPMQAVTVGEIATEFAAKLFNGDEYADYLYYHGMAVQTAEALAEWTHARIRRELGYGDLEPDNIDDMLKQHFQGSRYSFGYPACPNIQDQYKQLELLGTDRINFYMDESEQIYPEQSTTAFIAYHESAKYFSS
ncbi:MAG: methionine synthase, partial [Cyanobacteria bacterium P01_F01_bin.42]